MTRANTPADIMARADHTEPNGCWVWTGTRSDRGYGLVQFQRRQWRAHRLVWSLLRGPIPDGLVVCHRCDNPPCVNPEHLFLGTNADNSHDRDRKGRGADRSGSHNNNAKLTEADVVAIRRSGLSDDELGRLFQVKPAHIARIRQRKRWTHV